MANIVKAPAFADYVLHSTLVLAHNEYHEEIPLLVSIVRFPHGFGFAVWIQFAHLDANGIPTPASAMCVERINTNDLRRAGRVHFRKVMQYAGYRCPID